MDVKIDIINADNLADFLRKQAGATVIDPYPEIVPTALEDKLLYLASSIYGGISPLPLFSFEKGGSRYLLSPRLHKLLADLMPGLKVLHIEVVGEPQYPFTAIALVLRDLGISADEEFLKEHVCPELAALEEDDVPLARAIRSAVSKYLTIAPSGASTRSIRCLCGLCEDRGSGLDLDALALSLTKRSVSRAYSRRGLTELNDEDRAIIMRVIRGLSIPEFRRELIDLLNRYEV
ncbi:hypothetical protein TUZN_0627 [Thermoproteus uzoniensis 768-20]|uniref:Uncharacterized protein n=1 Tax=Thermoproteus uzoniensis (strain 768-20) TaxID=999630 RepID=F2L463_THEU7|nr:hypothetical protein [Thermoproteus uzoniensis]AEA12119.1 hypothetical protein TUZN_0627 [Thermoproteus uzoniensis 768-20]